MTTTQAAPQSNLVTLTVNGVKVQAPKGMLLVEAAKLAGIEIPVFCYHPKLKPVGACRMCLVEIEKMPRLQTACTTPVAEGMVVRTQSENAVAGQNAVVGLLLANHPLDCPICDKGGECPLQDNTFKYGQGVSRFQEEKRHKDKAYELSERIVLDKERCILCYRCVRFHDEIPGDRQLTVVDRGAWGEIDVPAGAVYDSPFQGNVTDICPVGALTSREYRFRARPWDLKRTPGVCMGCSVGCNTEVHSRDGRVLRLVPRENLDVNDAWLCDKGRYDTLPEERDRRLAQPLVRKDGALVPATWEEALRSAGRLLSGPSVGAVLSPSLTNEALALAAGPLRYVLEQKGARFASWPRPAAGFEVKGRIADVPKSKSILLVGLDPWTELPILALPIRKAAVSGGSLVVVNAENGLFRDTRLWLKAGRGEEKSFLQDLVAALEGKPRADARFAEEARKAAALLGERPTTLLVGQHVAADPEARVLVEVLASLLSADGSGGLVGAPTLSANGGGVQKILPELASLDAGGKGGLLHEVWNGQIERLLLVGDTGVEKDAGRARVVLAKAGLPKDAASVLPGNIDVVLPLAHPYEQAGSAVSLEGRVQSWEAAGIPPPGSRADWAALALLSTELGLPMPADLRALRKRLSEAHPFLSSLRAGARVELRVA